LSECSNTIFGIDIQAQQPGEFSFKSIRLPPDAREFVFDRPASFKIVDKTKLLLERANHLGKKQDLTSLTLVTLVNSDLFDAELNTTPDTQKAVNMALFKEVVIKEECIYEKKSCEDKCQQDCVNKFGGGYFDITTPSGMAKHSGRYNCITLCQRNCGNCN
jgi:hypothetical protein